MDIDEEFLSNKNICFACLCVGRRLQKITNENLLQYYTDILDEIPVSSVISVYT